MMFDKVTKCCVSEQNVYYALNTEKVGVFKGTGFIVDQERGIIATNFHVTTLSEDKFDSFARRLLVLVRNR